MEKRFEAEEQQRHLKAALTNRAKIIDSMDALLLLTGVDNQTEIVGLTTCGGKNEGATLFRTFQDELDLLYAQTDEILSALDFKMTWPLTYKPVRRQHEGMEVIDSANSTAVPYSFERMCHAMSSLMLADPEGRRFDQGIQDPENTVATKYHLRCRLKGGDSAEIATYTVTRRFAEANRMVFVWRALYEGRDAMSGFHSAETGWFVVRPLLTCADSADSHEAFSTVLECHTRFVPTGIAESASSKAQTDRFARILAKAGVEEVNAAMKRLERMLLGDKQIYFPSLVVCE